MIQVVKFSPTINLVLVFFIFQICYNSSQCPYRHYRDIQKSVCIPCKLHCNICTYHECIQCQNQPQYLYNYEKKQCVMNKQYLTARRILVDCSTDNNCDICPSNNQPCQQCLQGFAPDGAGKCKACHNSCKTCNAPSNAGNCQTCFVGDFLQTLTSHCKHCDQQFGNKCLQCNQINCISCKIGFYPVSGNPGCTACPTNCQICISSNGCELCDQYYELNINQTCTDICGDQHNINLPCDLRIGIAYDGCSDNCSVESNFSCNNTLFVTDCFYLGQINMTIESMVRFIDSNTIQMVVDLFPPLYAFQFTNLYQLFSINDSQLVITNLAYQNENLIFRIQFISNVANLPFQILFNPNSSSDPHLNQAQQEIISTKIITQIPAYFYSQQTFILGRVLAGFCILIVVLSYLNCCLAIGSRRLAGLELMFILQFGWISLLWLPQFIPTTYYSAVSLKYSSGFNIPIQKFSYSSRLPIQAMPFNVDIMYFNNNFNLSLGLYALPIFLLIIFKILSLKDEYKKKMIPKYEFCQQMTLYATLFNFIGLIMFSFIFFSSGQKTSFPSIIAFLFASLITLGTLIKFYFDPDPFDRFRYQFKIQKLAVFHIYFHALNILLTVLFLCLITNYSWVCCLPPIVLLTYSIIYRPYKELSQNFRSAYFQLIIALTLGLRCLYISSSNQWRMSEKSGLLLVILLCIFYISGIIWSYVSVILSLCQKYNGQKKKNKQQINYILFEDMKFLQKIANTQRLLQISSMIKNNEENKEIDDRINGNQNEDKQLVKKFQRIKNISNEIKNQRINGLQTERKQYLVEIQMNQNQNKKVDEQKFQKAINVQLSQYEKVKDQKTKQIQRLPFKIQRQPVFKSLFNYGGSLTIYQQPVFEKIQINKDLGEEDIIQQQEQLSQADKKKQKQITIQDIENNQKIKEALGNEINFIKFKLAQKLTKTVKNEHLESYHKIQ